MDIKVKTSRKEQEAIDTLQPFTNYKGKIIRNEKFERFYGKDAVEKAKRPPSGEAIEKEIDWDRINQKPSTKKYYF